MRKWIAKAGLILAAGLVVIQFVPVERVSPPVEGAVQVPADLKAVLARSCYDCHSNETVWPWYSRIAPVSWLIAEDVKKGRVELNFSIWDQYNERRKARKLKEIVKQVEHSKMPQWYYVALHPDAKLSASDKEIILKWAK
jgi:cytochrome c551/c552